MSPTRQETIRAALLAACKGRTPDEIAQRCTPPICGRTVQRLLSGRTFSEATVAKVARVLRVDVDNLRPLEHQDAPPSTKTHQNAPNLSGPVAGWKQAARVLGVHRNSLIRLRKRLGLARKPWWSSAESLLTWYEGVLLGLAA